MPYGSSSGCRDSCGIFSIEVAVGKIDGVNDIFTTNSQAKPGPIIVWLNGVTVRDDALIFWEDPTFSTSPLYPYQMPGFYPVIGGSGPSDVTRIAASPLYPYQMPGSYPLSGGSGPNSSARIPRTGLFVKFISSPRPGDVVQIGYCHS